MIANADYVIDLGPGGGTNGGRIVAATTPALLPQTPESLTAIPPRHPVARIAASPPTQPPRSLLRCLLLRCSLPRRSRANRGSRIARKYPEACSYVHCSGPSRRVAWTATSDARR
jgi:hypothetical protein